MHIPYTLSTSIPISYFLIGNEFQMGDPENYIFALHTTNLHDTGRVVICSSCSRPLGLLRLINDSIARCLVPTGSELLGFFLRFRLDDVGIICWGSA